MLTKLDPQRFDEVYAIMEESFPVKERRSLEGQRALLANKLYQIWTFNDESTGKVKAFLATYDLPEALFLEHFAVASAYRNQGLGAQALQCLKGFTAKPICLEAEPPTADIARRRIEFYKRNGFFLHDYPYIQPPIEEGKSPVPLRIMTTQKRLTPSAFTCIKATIYREVYGKIVAD